MNQSLNISKGYFLGKWLFIGEKLQKEMRAIFIRNGLNTPDLRKISEEDRLRWYELKKKNDRVASNICKTISL